MAEHRAVNRARRAWARFWRFSRWSGPWTWGHLDGGRLLLIAQPGQDSADLRALRLRAFQNVGERLGQQRVECLAHERHYGRLAERFNLPRLPHP
jgi:hypothetical protein